VLLSFETEYKECEVAFIITSRDSTQLKLIKAIELVNEAACSAITLINRIEHLKPTKLIYEFDLEIEQWLPRHAITKEKGIISDHPLLIALDKYKGFSVSIRIMDKSSDKD